MDTHTQIRVECHESDGGADRRNAITEFKNKIVEKGGNAGVISNQLNSKAGFEISGYALDCENIE